VRDQKLTRLSEREQTGLNLDGTPYLDGARSENPLPLGEIPLEIDVSTTGQRRKVFLVHGRDIATRDAMIDLLESFDLRVIHWRDAAVAAGSGTPYTGNIVRAGLEMADGVVVLLTPDDVGYVRREFLQPNDGQDESNATGQARQNVIFEAGMAMALNKDAVVLVEVGHIRRMTDTEGLNVVRLNDDVERRKISEPAFRAPGLPST
jgi:predicted nucleotide-binding protein